MGLKVLLIPNFLQLLILCKVKNLRFLVFKMSSLNKNKKCNNKFCKCKVVIIAYQNFVKINNNNI